MTMTPAPSKPTLGEREPEPWQGSVEELRGLVSDRALTGETLLLNMGPHHPSTHGVLRLLLELDGEQIVTCMPDVGYLHTGIEKNIEFEDLRESGHADRPHGLPRADVEQYGLQLGGREADRAGRA